MSRLLSATRRLPPKPSVGAAVFLNDWTAPGGSGYAPWTNIHMKNDVVTPVNWQLNLVTDIVRPGASVSAQFTVHPGDFFGAHTTERCEVTGGPADEQQGDEYWYGWSTYWPTDWTAPTGWGNVLQWHADPPITQPVAFNAWGDILNLDINAGIVTGTAWTYNKRVQVLNPMLLGVWHDFVMRAYWHLTDGVIQVWHRLAGETSFVKVVDLQAIPNLQYWSDAPGGAYLSTSYMKHGLYRNGGGSNTNVLYHGALVRGRTLGAVMPAFNDSWSFAA